ncbi:hypothetical protein SSX86_023157 [Deinandra increscens subsp. villosa]|uniref:Filament-like plant protein 3 n=1 Tax=Deinandra increscens subsp. villosa TaxID=3103831 RepID=A0AAP0CKB6_9ASTR
MDRRSWLWRRKSTEKSAGETESSGGSVSSHSERFLDDQAYSNQNSQSLEVASTVDPRQSDHDHVVKSLSEKLSEALLTITAKEELVNQHVKVAEEAVSGWEKAEREVVALRHQIGVLTVKNSALEEQVDHLDGALKECLRQLRQTREEKDQIANEAERDTNLHHKLEMSEKENSDLKHKISLMAEELEIRIIERELSNQVAEQASKQHLDGAKKVAKLEAECRRLKSALKRANDHPLKARKKPSISITEKGDFKETGRFGRNRTYSFEEIDLMNDFLEMERLVGLPGSSEVEDRLKKDESLETAEYKLVDSENKLKASLNQNKEAESKMVDCEIELKASRHRLEEAKCKLAERENELKLSRYQLETASAKLAELEIELNASTYLLEEAEFKLHNTASRLEVSEAGLEAANVKKEEAESRCKALEAEIEILVSKVDCLENDIQKERDSSRETEAKYQDLKDEVSRLQHEVQDTKSRTQADEFRFLKIKQDRELAITGSKFAECQKTIASLNRQLEALATLDDFLIDTNEL